MSWQVTNTQFLTVIGIIVIPLIGWGISVETRFAEPHENTRAIKEVKLDVKENTVYIGRIDEKIDDKLAADNKNFLLVLSKLHDIQLQLKDKKDRD